MFYALGHTFQSACVIILPRLNSTRIYLDLNNMLDLMSSYLENSLVNLAVYLFSRIGMSHHGVRIATTSGKTEKIELKTSCFLRPWDRVILNL